MNKCIWQCWLFSPARYLVGAAFLLCALVWFINQQVAILAVEISNPLEAVPILIDIPYSALSDAQSRSVIYTVSIDHKTYGPVKWRIIADDCIRSIEVNEQPVDLAAAKGDTCDYQRGIILDLSAYLKKGMNVLTVAVEDTGGAYGFNIIPIPSLPGPFPLMEGSTPLSILLFNGLVAAVFILYSCYFLRHRNVDYWSIGLFILSAIVSLHYFHISNNDTWTNDVEWHLNYIAYVSQHWLDPYGYSIWTVNHPPLYYYVAAALAQLNQIVIGLPDTTIQRFLSWVSFLVFHIFNLLTLRRAGFSGTGYYVCAALLLLWPGNAHMASKINSEPMYYAVAAMSFYYTIVWYQEGRQRDLMKALIAAGIASTVRTNAVILFALIGTLVITAIFRKRMSIRVFLTMQWMMVAVILLLCFSVCFGGLFFHYHAINTFPSGTPIFLEDLLSLKYSFFSPFKGWDNRQGFLEYLLKTSMFGEYQWPSPGIMTAMNYFVVAIFCYAVLPWFFATRAQWRGMLPYVLFLVFSMLFLLCFVLLLAKDLASRDARYIYPALICFVVLFGKSHTIYTQRGAWLLSWLGPVLVAGFTIISTYFFWNNFR